MYFAATFVYFAGISRLLPHPYSFHAGSEPVLSSDATAEAEIAFGDALVRVNGIFIKQVDFDRAFARVNAHSTAADANALAFDVLNSMIEQELIVQYADATEIEIDAAEVDSEIDRLQSNLRDKRWESWLEENGFREEELRIAVYMQLVNSKVREQITAHLYEPVEHVRARHILVIPESKAEALVDRLARGESFALLAALSRDVSTRDFGGDLGWFIRGEMIDRNLSDAAFSQPIGEVSGPIATRLGYHVLQVLGYQARWI